MTDIKKPKWDSCDIRGITSAEHVPFSAIDGPVEIGMRVYAKYKDKSIGMDIISEISHDLFEAEIFDIDPHMATYEGLSLEDRVELPRKAICWIQKK